MCSIHTVLKGKKNKKASFLNHEPQPLVLGSKSLGSGRVTQRASRSGAMMGLLPSKQQECPDECFQEGSETRPNFSFFLFQTGLSMGNFPRTTPLLFHRDVCPLRSLWVVFLTAKGKRKRKGKGEKNPMIHPWRPDNNKIYNKVKYDDKSNGTTAYCTLTSLPTHFVRTNCLLQYLKENHF